MTLLGDSASPRPRVSVTKLAATAQGGTALATAAVVWLNRRFDLGLDQEAILIAAALLIAAVQSVGTWAQRRASERIDQKLRPVPSGREPGR